MKLTENSTQPLKGIKKVSPVAMFIIIAFSIGIGFLAGNYKYEIMAAISPVFGYNAHSGSLDLSSVQETYNALAGKFDGKLNTKKLIEGASRGLVAAAGDDYTIYMSQKEASDFDDSLNGNIGGGIGAEIGTKNNKVIIVRALQDNPAEKVGLNANDIILSVNDESTDGWTVEKTVSVIRGEAGTTVKLSIQRGSEIKEFVITREIINNPSVDSSVADGLGVLTISRFDDQTGRLAKLAAQNLKKQNVKAVILDLRSDGGGYVTAAVEVAGLWLDNKVVMNEKIGGRLSDVLRTESGDAILSDMPTMVLVNSGSASASEILAGALRDNKAAKLVGEKTFGKGSIQEQLSLSDDARIKVTIAHWFTPHDASVNKKGLTPDITVELTQADIDKGVDTQLDAAKKALGL